MMKKAICIILFIVLLFSLNIAVFANNNNYNRAENTSAENLDFSVDAKSAVLMEAETGKILFSQNESEAASPASVTKVMTLLLVMEAIAEEKISLSDKVIVSDFAASMGGSQVFLEEGESMTVEELLKCTVIASANDAAVALAEQICGSEKAFVNLMNKRASELGMENTNFENVTGLDDTVKNHYTTALDIAIMSRELIKYDKILEFSSLWQDTIRDGAFTLTNTNRLVRYYEGCNGLKTGSTDKAGYCISATAKRNGMTLIAVIMGAPTRDARNYAARCMLDFGFSNYSVYSSTESLIESVPVYKGEKNYTSLYSTEFKIVTEKNNLKKIEKIYEIPEYLTAPLKEGGVVGSVTYKLGEEVIGKSDIILKENIEQISFFDIFCEILASMFRGSILK
jgi:D-alanyl-D-alanine carboxypeptidase (penicillin-binding protein 5/6)